jgi:hypothetical protein
MQAPYTMWIQAPIKGMLARAAATALDHRLVQTSKVRADSAWEAIC